MDHSLAIDIGASSGRHILGKIKDGKFVTREIYRFENALSNVDGHLVWDTERLFENVKEGLKRCAREGIFPKTIAIDTWGVDYVLLDKDKNPLLPAYSYRDGALYERDLPGEVEEILGGGTLFNKTGIQTQSFNTVYQLWLRRGELKDAAHFLMMPEYLSYRLTGEMKNEYTNSTTTSLLNAFSKSWDREILDKLRINPDILSPPVMPPAPLGRFSREIEKETGFSALVLLAPSHDTASAVAACPMEDNGAFISSGTWSLVGTELPNPVINNDVKASNFTNEGGIEGRFRFLKNIMGMWLFQGMKKSLGKCSYDDMMNAAKESSFTETFDPNSPSLTAPDDMETAIRALLKKPDLPHRDVLNSIYHSLALSYKKAIDETERLTGKKITSITIIGGGSRDRYLNSLTKEITRRRVLAGPTEATALGNLLSQFMYLDKSLTLEKGREIIKNSFNTEEVK